MPAFNQIEFPNHVNTISQVSSYSIVRV